MDRARCDAHVSSPPSTPATSTSSVGRVHSRDVRRVLPDDEFRRHRRSDARARNRGRQCDVTSTSSTRDPPLGRFFTPTRTSPRSEPRSSCSATASGRANSVVGTSSASRCRSTDLTFTIIGVGTRGLHGCDRRTPASRLHPHHDVCRKSGRRRWTHVLHALQLGLDGDDGAPAAGRQRRAGVDGPERRRTCGAGTPSARCFPQLAPSDIAETSCDRRCR